MKKTGFNLNTKLTLTATSLIVVTVLITIIVTLYFGNKIGKSAIQNKLSSSQLIQNKFIQQRGRQLELISLLVASDPSFVAYIAQSTYEMNNSDDESFDMASISDLLLERQQQYGFDLALVISADLYQLARSDRAMATKRNLGNLPVVQKASEELLPVSGYFEENGKLYQSAIVPIARGQNLIGFLLTGLNVDNELTNDIARLTGTEILVISQTDKSIEPIASSMDVNYTSALKGQVNQLFQERQSIETIESISFDVNDLNLASQIKALDKQNHFILTGVPTNKILQPFITTRNILLLIGLVMILLAFVIANLLVKKTLSPLSALSKTAKNIASGNYEKKLNSNVSRDLVELNDSINKLSNDIRGKDSLSKHLIEISKKSHLTNITSSTENSDEKALIKIGDIIGNRFEIIDSLGVGGMGYVFKAIDLDLDEIMAIKVLKNIYNSESDINRFKDEIRLARRIAHPNVVRTHDFGQLKEHVFISMEYVQGYTLEQLIKYSVKLSPYAARHAAIHICKGLIAAHASGVIHRDLKPANIIIELDSSIKLMDFGIATLQNIISKEKTFDNVEGTSAYLSQEQVLGKGSDERSDIYAIGVLLMEMFVGKRPFYGKTEEEIMIKQVQEAPTPITHWWADAPIALEELILKCLEKNPKDRYQSVKFILIDLLKIKFD
jgi:HAMP domain-containing protein